ncbi:leukocyte receptor cluster member 1 [Thrips palmi]|uniref:Leukocyte receptor cluster member 1 n=1 Tax=Thrips palmi TaxID=161013 RepID=A0A6P8ZX70_THRPL|nr:leukocyte receptor cluster member 1 [Thrips palmi]
MNILPKKRWHVRTKDNIARVRRDEAQAAEEEKERERKIKLAEKEARRDLMRIQARAKYGTKEINKEEDEPEEKNTGAPSRLEHINFFAEEEAGLVSSTAVNKDHEEEKKQEKEKYEKQIGYLTYLGQDTNEATGNVSWYNKCPDREEVPNEETGLKHKMMSDPLNSFRKFCASSFSKKSTPAIVSAKSSTSGQDSKRHAEKSLSPERQRKSHLSKQKREKSYSPEESREKRKKNKDTKHKKEKKRKSSHSIKSKYDSDSDECSTGRHADAESSEDEDKAEKRRKLEKLRAERLRREKEEKKKADKLMAKVHGVAYIDDDEKPQPKPVMKQRYNSQFNPNLAKQNYEDQRYRF